MVEFSLFDLVGLGDVTGIDMLFAASALVGGILFTLYFFLLMIGGIATDIFDGLFGIDCLLYTSPSPRDQRGSRMPSSA